MNIINTLFGGDKNIIDEALDGIDSTTLTAQEVIEYRLKARENYGPFKIIQRLLSLIFCVPYVVFCVVLMFLDLSGAGVSDSSIKLLDSRLGDSVALIVGFYFLGGVIRK